MTPIRIVELPRGRWSPGDDVEGAELLVSVIEGLIVCDLALGDIVSSQLLGEGDLLACGDAFETTLPRDQLWTVISPARVGVIDIATARMSPSWPRGATRLTTAFTSQLRRSAQMAAIGHLPRVEDRVLGLLWHLADRYGRVTPDGVIVPVDLTHVVIGQLIGARRSTVSLALRRLDVQGHVWRREDGGWGLSPDSAAELVPGHGRRGQRVLRSNAAMSLARRRQAAVAV